MTINKSTVKILIPLLLGVILFAAAIAPAAAQDTPPGSGIERAQSKPVFDRHFIDYMVPAHQAYIEMAKIGLERSTREDLKAFLTSEIQTAEAENEKMLKWRADWFGSDRTPPLNQIPNVPETPLWEMGQRYFDATPHLELLRTVDDQVFDLVLIDHLMMLNSHAVYASLVTRHHDERREIYNLARSMVVSHERANITLQQFRETYFYFPDGTGTPTPVVTGTVTPDGTLTPGVTETVTPEGTQTPGVTETVTPVGTVTPGVTETVVPPGTETPGVTETVLPGETITPVVTGTVTVPPPETATPGVTDTVVPTQPTETITPAATIVY